MVPLKVPWRRTDHHPIRPHRRRFYSPVSRNFFAASERIDSVTPESFARPAPSGERRDLRPQDSYQCSRWRNEAISEFSSTNLTKACTSCETRARFDCSTSAWSRHRIVARGRAEHARHTVDDHFAARGSRRGSARPPEPAAHLAAPEVHRRPNSLCHRPFPRAAKSSRLGPARRGSAQRLQRVNF
jgi:hypothetical protein